MDTLSHAAWGYLTLRWRGKKAAFLAGVSGAAPDLLYFIPSKTEQILETGWSALSLERDPRIWRADGPPLPPELVEAYHTYYVYTHSLVILCLVAALLLFLGKRSWMWFTLPYGLHIAMDIPTHERYLTPILYPLSNWTVSGLSWADARIFWPNLIALLIAFSWMKWKFRNSWRKERATLN